MRAPTLATITLAVLTRPPALTLAPREVEPAAYGKPAQSITVLSLDGREVESLEAIEGRAADKLARLQGELAATGLLLLGGTIGAKRRRRLWRRVDRLARGVREVKAWEKALADLRGGVEGKAA